MAYLGIQTREGYCILKTESGRVHLHISNYNICCLNATTNPFIKQTLTNVKDLFENQSNIIPRRRFVYYVLQFPGKFTYITKQSW